MPVYGDPQTENHLNYWGRYFNVDPTLGRVVMRKESSLGRDRGAYTPNQYGVVGPMQLSPPVVRDFNRYATANNLPQITDPNDMGQAVMGGMWYLRQGLDRAAQLGYKNPAAYTTMHYSGDKTGGYTIDASNKHSEYPTQAAPPASPAPTEAPGTPARAPAATSAAVPAAASTPRTLTAMNPQQYADLVRRTPELGPAVAPSGGAGQAAPSNWRDLIAAGRAPASMEAAPPSAFVNAIPGLSPQMAEYYRQVSTPAGYAAALERPQGAPATAGTAPAVRPATAPAFAGAPATAPAPGGSSSGAPALPEVADTSLAMPRLPPGLATRPPISNFAVPPDYIQAPSGDFYGTGLPARPRMTLSPWGYALAPPNPSAPLPGQPGAPLGTAGIAGARGGPSGEVPEDVPPPRETAGFTGGAGWIYPPAAPARTRVVPYPEERSSFWGALLPPGRQPSAPATSPSGPISSALIPPDLPVGALGSPLSPMTSPLPLYLPPDFGQFQ